MNIDTNAAARHAELTALIRDANHRYYVLDEPTLEDVEYDGYMRQLRSLEESYPELVTADSPTQTVGVAASQASETAFDVEHATQLYSLRNVVNMEELRSWLNRIGYESGSVTLWVEPKYDGLTVETVYVNHNLVSASTRGDGTVGENVMTQLLAAGVISKTIEVPGVVQLVGEIMLNAPEYAQAQELRAARGHKAYANPRNAAAGILRSSDDVELQRLLTFYGHEAKMSESLSDLKEGRFELLDASHLTGTSEDLGLGDVTPEQAVELFAQKRRELQYATDGLVFKVADGASRRRLGYTTHSPNWAVAYKYPPEEVITTVLGIRLQAGRTGRVTPVAILDPVSLAGSTVSAATLNNFHHIAKLGVYPGCQVMLRKACEIIPEIVKVVSDPKPEQVPSPPTHCEHCGSPLQMLGAYLHCTGVGDGDCSASTVMRAVYLVSRDVLDVESIGDKAIQALYDGGLIRRPFDLWHVPLSKLQMAMGEMDGVSAKRNLLKALRQPLYRMIMALEIPGVGKSTAKMLATAYGSLDLLRGALADELMYLPDIGRLSAERICSYLSSESFQGLLRDIEEAGFEITDESIPGSVWHRDPVAASRLARHNVVVTRAAAPEELSLAGHVILVSGSFPGVDRDYVKSVVIAKGGRAVSSFSKNVTSAIFGNGAAQHKVDSAARAGIPVYDLSWLENA